MPVLTPTPSDIIHLDTRVSCIVGILDRERVEPQPIRVRVRLGLDLGAVGETGDLAQGVDYAAVDTQVRFLAVEGRFRLIESLALAVLRAVLLPPAPDEGRASVSWAEVRITKPAVLREAVPAVELRRDAAWAAPERDGVLVAVPEVIVRRRTLAAGEEVADGVALGIGALRGAVALPHRFERPSTVLHLVRDQTGRVGLPDPGQRR